MGCTIAIGVVQVAVGFVCGSTDICKCAAAICILIKNREPKPKARHMPGRMPAARRVRASKPGSRKRLKATHFKEHASKLQPILVTNIDGHVEPPKRAQALSTGT